MKKVLNLTVTESLLDKYTSDTSSIEETLCKSKKVHSCMTPRHLESFPTTAHTLYKLFAKGTWGGQCYKLNMSTGETIAVTTIRQNTTNGFIFKTFSKFGIVTNNLTVGISKMGTIAKVYVATKLLRDLSKYSEETQFSLIAMIYSLAQLCYTVSFKKLHCTITDYEERLSLDHSFDDNIASFIDGMQFEISEMPDDGYTSVTCYNAIGCPFESESKTNIRYALVAPEKEGSISTADAVAVLPIPGSTHFAITDGSTMYTTLELTWFDIMRDSYYSKVIAAAESGFVITHIAKEDVKNVVKLGYTLYTLSEDLEECAVELETYKPSFKKWLTNVHKGTFEPISDMQIDTLSTRLGLKTSSGESALDKEAMEKFYEKDDYAQALYKQLKPYYDTFDLGTLSANLRGFANGTIYSMLFIGDSGTGKSTAARVLPARCGIPYVSINFSVNIEEADIFGTMVPNVTKTSAEEPEFIWQDGVLTKAIRYGYCAVLEELNFARPGVLGKLNSLLDENRQIDLPNGEILKAHPHFRVIATCNIAYEGTNRLNKALVNRFDDCTVFKDMDRHKAIETIKARTGYKNATKLDTIYNVYEALKKFSKEQNLSLIVSMRQLLTLFTNGKSYKDAEDAVRRIMINGAFIEEPEFQEVFEQTVLPAFNLKFKI